MNEAKQLVKEQLEVSKVYEAAHADEYEKQIFHVERKQQKREWREQQNHLRNLNKGSLLRK